jgi:Ca2+-binding RTX toxin-like protein
VRDATARDGASIDALSQFDTEIITLTVAQVNLQPVAHADSVTFEPGEPVTIQLTGDDGDPNVTQALTFALVTQPANGTLTSFNAQTGTGVYTPNSAAVTGDSFTFRVMDDGGTDDGGQDTSAPATITLTAQSDEVPVSDADIRAARLRRGTLRIKGSRHDDVILVGLNEAATQLEVTLNSRDVQTFDLDDVRRIRICGRKGDDFIRVDADVDVNARIDAGRGNDIILAGGGDDRIAAGSGNDIVVGSDGNDRLGGGRGRDLLIGGDDADQLRGRKHDDLMIAGTTAFDANHEALLEILAEWTSSRDFDTRVLNLEDGSGGSERLNGDTFLVTSGAGQSVFDDGDDDRLRGDRGRDWFFASDDDEIRRLRSGDLVEELTAAI